MSQSKALFLRTLESSGADSPLPAVLRAVDQGVLFTALDHTALLCNARFGELFDIQPELVVQQDPIAVREMVHRRIAKFEDWERNLEAVYAHPDWEQEDELELTSPRTVLRRFTAPVRGEDGEVVGRIWTFADCTQERRKAEQQEAIRRASLFFHPDPRVVCQHVADLVAAHYGSIALISIQEESFLHFHTVGGPPGPASGIAGNRLEDSFCQFCLTASKPLVIQDATKEPRSRSLLPVSLGLTRYLGVPIFDPLGLVIGTLCILDGKSHELLDGSDSDFMQTMVLKVSAELERQRQLNRLESNLAETSEELRLTQSKLIQNEKLAIAGTLAAAIAHDIRNILASLSLQIDIGEGDPEGALAYVRESLNRFNVLAHRLLSYAKPKRALLEHLDLCEVASRVAELLTPQFQISKVILSLETSDAPCFVKGDEGRLEHLIVNLAINALQALKNRGTVRIRVFPTLSGVNLEVIDDGPGISAEKLAKLFEPFESSRPEGFGLGLYSCRQIVLEHDAELECVSHLGSGATFLIKFPRPI